MERLLYFLPAPHQPIYIRYGTTAILMLCSIAVFIALEMQSGFVGLFLLLPGIFLAGIMYDRGSGFLATFMGAAAGLWSLWEEGFWAATLPLLLFVFIGIAFATVAELLRKEMEKVVAAERAKGVLLQELHTAPKITSRC